MKDYRLTAYPVQIPNVTPPNFISERFKLSSRTVSNHPRDLQTTVKVKGKVHSTTGHEDPEGE